MRFAILGSGLMGEARNYSCAMAHFELRVTQNHSRCSSPNLPMEGKAGRSWRIVSAHEGDPVEFLLDDDMKVGESVVVGKGAHAVAAVFIRKKGGNDGQAG